MLDLNQPEEDLDHAYRGFAEIAGSASGLQVPIGALFRSGDRWECIRRGGRVAAASEIKIGRMSDDMAQVLGGLAVGAGVVIHPSIRLEDDSLARRDYPPRTSELMSIIAEHLQSVQFISFHVS